MKKLLKIFLLCSLFISCKTWDVTKIAVKKDAISPKLLTLDKQIDDIANVRVVISEDGKTVFTKEVEDNLIDPYGEKFGYIVMKQNIIKANGGLDLILPNLLTLGIPMLFGCPIATSKYIIEVELRIMDSRNRLLGKYSAIGIGSAIAAMYYGYTLEGAERKSYTDALNDAFNQIRPQIQKDVSVINEKLKLAGK